MRRRNHNPRFGAECTEEAIELEMEKPITCVESALLGRASRIVDAAGRYISDEKNLIPLSSNGLCDAEITIPASARNVRVR
jgi:hypothetical protein